MTYTSDQLLAMYCDLNEDQKEEFLAAIQSGERIGSGGGSADLSAYAGNVNLDNSLILELVPAVRAVWHLRVGEDDATFTGGTWTITVDGNETGPIAWDANAAAIAAALEAFVTIDIPIHGLTAFGYMDIVIPDLVNLPEGWMTADGSGLTGPAEPYDIVTFLDVQGSGVGVEGQLVPDRYLSIQSKDIEMLAIDGSISISSNNASLAASTGTASVIATGEGGQVRIAAEGVDGAVNVYLRSPDGTQYKLTVDDAGVLTAEAD